MAKTTRSWSPLAFLKPQITTIGSLIYAAAFVAVIFQHVFVPPTPKSSFPISGINLTQAWRDLEFISDGFHPWSSRRNGDVREYLLARIEDILSDVDHQVVYPSNRNDNTFFTDSKKTTPSLVTVFANDTSNFTSVDLWSQRPVTSYGESQNILVYIRGELEDSEGDWWNETMPYTGPSGVLVSAHYDSVSTGLGSTDDGVGVVSVLQVISHFAHHRPKRGIVALLNNGEEDGLFGAYNYLRHPISQLPHTFVNLEGAGAGGRAMLFRSTDAEVTKAYAKSPSPFGNVVSADGFSRGFIRSGTDYTIFADLGGLRGLDIAFYEPRARYHTDQDSKSNTSPASVWHMLSSALATITELTKKGGSFEGSRGKDGTLHIGSGSYSFFFDLLGLVFAVGKLNTLFAISVTLLVAGPVLLLLLEVLLRRSDKWYVFAGKRYLHSSDDDESVRIHGRRGFFRFPIAFIASTAMVVALAFLLTKINPFILYSSEYAVWAMMLSIFFVVTWFFMALAANTRPTALHRMFVLFWMYAISWIMLVFVTIGEKNLHLGSGYFLVIYQAAVLVALMISYLELFALPTISTYVAHVLGAQQNDAASVRPGSRSSRQLLDASAESQEDNEPTERTSLLDHSPSRASQHTFTRFSRRRADRDEVPEDTEDPFLNKAYMDEQAWSSKLPQWTWVLQFLILAPINIIIVGQLALLITSAIKQTSADGNPVLGSYFIIAGLTVLLLLPLAPFLHRFSYHIPTFLFLIFIGCLIYNLLAFPFSRESRMKYYFVQSMDLSTGVNNVSINGLDGYIQTIIAEIPSAAGQAIPCSESTIRKGLTECTYHGLPPNVVPRNHPGLLPPHNHTLKHGYKSWLDFNITRTGQSASISLRGLNTKKCRIVFENAVSEIVVEGAGLPDPRMPVVPEEGGGSNVVQLFSRTWDKRFGVNVTWEGNGDDDGNGNGNGNGKVVGKGDKEKKKKKEGERQKGRVYCLWEDVNFPGRIPAFDEVRRFEPFWSAVTKSGSGLLEGFKEFEV